MDGENKTGSIKDWFKKNHFNIIFAIIFGVGGYLLWSNTKPQEPKSIEELIKTIKENAKTVTTQRHSKEKTKVEQEFKDSSPSYYCNPFWNSSVDSVKTTVESSKEEEVPECYTIRLDDFENALKAVALVSRQEAAEDYHKSFSILVAMLAIFGIGFPLTVAFVQHRFNERDLNKIENTATKADEAIKQVNSIKMEANGAIKDANKSLKENAELKNENLAIYQTLHAEVASIYTVLAVAFARQINCYNLQVVLRMNSLLYQIKEIETKIRKNNFDIETLRKSIIENCNEIQKFIDEIKKLNKNDTEIMEYKDAQDEINILFNQYQDILDNIINNLPKIMHNDIDKLRKTIQLAIDILNK